MPITWAVDITNVNIDSKRADVVATRTDSAEPESPEVYRLRNVLLDTTQDRTAALDQIKAQVEAKAAKEAAIEAMVTTVEAQAKQALETWETTR